MNGGSVRSGRVDGTLTRWAAARRDGAGRNGAGRGGAKGAIVIKRAGLRRVTSHRNEELLLAIEHLRPREHLGSAPGARSPGPETTEPPRSGTAQAVAAKEGLV